VSTRSVLAVTFRTSLGKRHTMRFQNPRADFVGQHVTAVRNTILNSGTQLFDDSVGMLTGFVGAKIITTTTETLF